MINEGKFPFIHLEIHGSSNKDGLVLNSGQLVTWLELANRLREINILTANNLTVSLATCHGAYIYREMSLIERAPFWGFVAPWDEIDEDDVEVSFNSFFDTLLDTLDFGEAVSRLNSSNNLPYRYHFYNSEAVFDRIWTKYEQESYSPEKFKKRVLDMMSQALTDYNVRTTMTIPQIKHFIESTLVNEKDLFKKKYRESFLIGG